MPKISIISAANENFAQHYGVMLTSLFQNKKTETEIELYLLHTYLSEQNKINILSITEKYKTNIHFIKVNIADYEDCIKKGILDNHLSNESYFRLSIARFSPKHLNKIIYLDCDLVILKDLADLWTIDIEQFAVGAVHDLTNPILDVYIKNLGINETNSYFNAGVMLINLKKWRYLNVEKFTFEFIVNRSVGDQAALNVILHNKCLYLERKYNYMVPSYHKEKNVIQPSIVHFIGSIKPWDYMYENMSKRLYYRYLRRSPWKYYVPKDVTYTNIKYKYLKKHYKLHNLLKRFKTYIRTGPMKYL